MSWMEKLENLEPTQEPLIEHNATSDDWYPSQKTSIPKDSYYPYSDYANSKQVLQDLSNIGEDVAEGFKALEDHWAISWFNPANLQTLLEENKLQPTHDDYQSLKDSLKAMQNDGHNVTTVLILLERTFAKSEFQQGLNDTAHLTGLTNHLAGISPYSKGKGDTPHEK